MSESLLNAITVITAIMAVAGFIALIVSQVIFYKKDTYRFDVLDHHLDNADHSNEKIESRVENDHKQMRDEHKDIMSSIKECNVKFSEVPSDIRRIREDQIRNQLELNRLQDKLPKEADAIKELQAVFYQLQRLSGEGDEQKKVIQEKDAEIAKLNTRISVLEEEKQKYKKKLHKLEREYGDLEL